MSSDGTRAASVTGVGTGHVTGKAETIRARASVDDDAIDEDDDDDSPPGTSSDETAADMLKCSPMR